MHTLNQTMKEYMKGKIYRFIYQENGDNLSFFLSFFLSFYKPERLSHNRDTHYVGTTWSDGRICVNTVDSVYTQSELVYIYIYRYYSVQLNQSWE